MASVKATGKFSVYFNYQVWNLVAGEQVDGALADYLLATGSPVEPVGPAVDVDGDGVPDGTAAQILEWVGTDPERAVAARDAEVKREPSRVTVIAALEKLIPTAPPAEPQATDPPVDPPADPPAEPAVDVPAEPQS